MILNWLSEKYPDQISPSVRRSLERRIQKWRQEREVQKEAMFSQFHHPGDVIAFDFVDLRELGVTIQSRPYPHLMFHAVLTCSNWEYIHLCQSESFEAVSRGLQDALMWAGGVPRRVRSDSLTAAVNNLSADHRFQPQYQQLLSHYGLEGHRINVRKGKEYIDYRHIIDSLIRKPGAFRNYRYMQHLFPTIRFRMAWDQLDGRLSERAAVKEYLKLLYDAKYEGEDRVDAALRQLLDANQEISADAVKAIITANGEVPLPTDVNVELPDLSDYETLCHKDVPDEETTSVPIDDNEVGDSVVIISEPAARCGSAASEPAVSDEFPASDRHRETGGTTEGTATADDSGTPSADGRSCGSGTLDAHSFSGRADGSGMSGTDTESSGPTAARFASASGQDMESVSVVSAAAADCETVRDASSRELPGSADQHSGFWQTRFGEDKFTLCAGGTNSLARVERYYSRRASCLCRSY